MDRDEELLSKLKLHQLDELFVQQHVVRRFSLNHADEFNTLQSLRSCIEDCLKNFSPDEPDRLFLSRKLRAEHLAHCINHFNIKENLCRIATGEKDVGYKNFTDDLNNVWVTDDAVCSALFDILHNHAKSILEIVEQLNFFDYYSPLAMTTLVSGMSIYECYIRARIATKTLNPKHEVTLFPEGSWLFTKEAATDDDDLFSLKSTYCYRLHRPSKNIKIFGGNQHDVTVDGEIIDNCLIFCVPTNQTPDRIDESLRYFRDALAQELNNNYFVSVDKNAFLFRNSDFMTHSSRAPLLVKNWDQVQRNIVGLWAWDLVNGKEKRAGNKKFIDIPYEVAQEMQLLKTYFEHDFDIYSETTIRHHYDDVTSSIGSINPQRRSPIRKLDRFVTGDAIVLGRRNPR